jgi:hypothetical protein
MQRPVISANCAFPAGRQIGRFHGHFRPLISRILVSEGVQIFATIFGALSLHQKIPCPAAVAEREVGPHRTRNSDIWAT